MADAKVEIEDLPSTTTQAKTDRIPSQKQGGNTVFVTIAQILGLINASDIASAAASGVADDTIDDTDKVVYLTGTTLKLGAFSGFIASIFKTTRTIASAQFAAATFKLFNAAGTPRALQFVITALTGDRTVTFPDGNVTIPAGTLITAADVPTAVAGLALGAIGTYAMLFYNTASETLAPGTTKAGSELIYANANGSTSGTSPSGTWRLMGWVTTGTTSPRVAIWLRIS